LDAGSPAEPPRWRRRLVAAGTARYENLDPDGQLPSVSSDVERVTRLLVDGFAYERATGTGLGLDPTSAELRDGLGEWLSGTTRDDVLVIYYSGHGEVASRQHYLLTRNSRGGGGLTWSAFPVEELGRTLSLASTAEYVLVLIDACYSGQGAFDLALALRDSQSERAASQPLRLWCITATRARQEAREGAFAAALAAAVADVHGGATQEFLGLEEIVLKVNKLLTGHEAQYNTFGSAGRAPFFPNAKYNAAVPVGIDLEAQRLGDFMTHWDPRSRGVEVASDPGSYFTGRRAVLDDLLAWLRASAAAGAAGERAPSVQVVTGGPGSGKSAVLARLVLLADPALRRYVSGGSAAEQDAAAGALPPGTWISALARNKTLGTLVTELAGQADVTLPAGSDPERAHALAGALASPGGSGTPVTILIDGLDEAASPGDIADQLIAPVAHERPPGLRLVVGTRPGLLGRLGPGHVVDLDDPRYFSEPDLAGYVERMLLAADSPTVATPYRSNPAVASQVAAAVAQRAGRSFLLARLVTRTLLAAEVPVDPADPGWLGRFPPTAGEAFERDLQGRFPDAYGRQRVHDLLTPLAFADGEGLPVADLWHAVATRLSGRYYSPDDVAWIQDSAASYIIEAQEDGRSVYRLYHQAITDYLRSAFLHPADRDTAGLGTTAGDGGRTKAVPPTSVPPEPARQFTGTAGESGSRTLSRAQRPFTDALIASVPAGPDGRRNWLAAHPYVLRHLGAHAAAAGSVDDLLTDVGFLVAADPDSVRRAAAAASGPLARAIGIAYGHGYHFFRDVPPWQRAQLLRLAARQDGLDELADQVAKLGLPWQWDPVMVRWRREAPYQVIGRQQSPIRAVAVTGLDGRQVAITGAVDGSVLFWDLETGTEAGSLPNHPKGAWAIALATVDGRRVAVVAGGIGSMYVWDLESRTLLRTLSVPARFLGPAEYANSLDVSEEGGRILLVSGGWDRVVRVWDLADGTCLREFESFAATIETVRFARLGGRLAVLVGAGYGAYRQGHGPVTVWDALTGERLRTLEREESNAQTFTTVYAGGRTLVVCAWGPGRLRTFDLETGKSARDFGYPVAGSKEQGRRSNGGYIRDIATTTVDGRVVAITGSNDGVVRLWDLTDRPATWLSKRWPHRLAGPLRHLEGHTDAVWAVRTATVDGRPVAVSGDSDGVLRRWDLGAAVSPPPGDPSTYGTAAGIDALAMTRLAGGSVIAAATDGNTVEIWDLAARSLLRSLGLPGREVTKLAALESSGRTLLASGQVDGTLRVFDLASGTEVWHAQLGDFGLAALAMAALPDGGVVVAAHSTTASAARVWKITGEWPIARIQDARSVALTSLDGRPTLLVEQERHGGLPDPKLVVWDLLDSREIRRFDLTEGGIISYAFAEVNGRPAVAHGGYSGLIQVRDLDTGNVLRTFIGHPEMIFRLEILAQGRSPVLISAPHNNHTGFVQAWDLGGGTGEPLCTIDLGAQVTALAADPVGDVVAVGTAKGFVALRFRLRASGA
jgi:WD40 repeat protein